MRGMRTCGAADETGTYLLLSAIVGKEAKTMKQSERALPVPALVSRIFAPTLAALALALGLVPMGALAAEEGRGGYQLIS